jgi:CDP-diglyceride synthetase
MYDKLYALGDLGIFALFGGVAVACFILAPLIGRQFGWTVPNKDRDDYIIRAQSTVITFTALILAFSLVQAQANLRKTEELVAKEASALNTLDRQLIRYGEEGAALRPLLWAYASSIVEDEWPELRHGKRSLATSAKLTPLTRPVFQLEPQSGRQSTIYAEMIKSVDEISDDREVRISAAAVRLPSEFWLMALILGVILVALSTVIEVAAYHTVSIAAQGLALALLAALVFCSDRPFEGDISVSPAPIAKTLDIMKART